MNKKKEADIDLIDLIVELLNSKWKILFSTVVAIVAMSLYVKPQPNQFISTTEIKPITILEENSYQSYNYVISKLKSNLNFYQNKDKQLSDNENPSKRNERSNKMLSDVNRGFSEINQKQLLNLFLATFRERGLPEAIEKFNWVRAENYDDQNEYEAAIRSVASSFLMIPPNYGNFDPVTDKSRYSWNIVFTYDDRKELVDLLEFAEKRTNQIVKENLINELNKLDQFLNEIIQFEIEDINNLIENAMVDYEKNIRNRVVFLKEQASIARELNLPKNNELSQTFINDTASALLPIKPIEILYYMRGYEIIEKEIDLIQNRTNKKAFIPNMKMLEKQKRDLILIQNNQVKRIKKILLNTPVGDSSNFKAAKIDIQAIKFDKIKIRLTNNKLIISSGIIGFILSALYILVSNAIRKRKFH